MPVGGFGTELIKGNSNNSTSAPCVADVDDRKAYVATDCTAQSSGSLDQRRTYTLSNGRVPWDLSGNVWEVTSDTVNINDKPSPHGNSWFEFPDVTGSASVPKTFLLPQIAIDNSWASINSIGKYRPGDQGSGGAVIRGAGWSQGVNAGVFATRLNTAPSVVSGALGFRCVMPIESE